MAELSKRKAESLSSGSAHTGPERPHTLCRGQAKTTHPLSLTHTRTHSDFLQKPGSWTSGKTTPQELLDAMISPVRLQFNLEDDAPDSGGTVGMKETVLGNPVPLSSHRDSLEYSSELVSHKPSLETARDSAAGRHGLHSSGK